MIKVCPNKNLVGINISDYSIKVVDVRCFDKKFEVVSSGMILMDPGVVSNGRIMNMERLKEYVKKVFAEASPRRIVPKEISFAIPERQVYSHIFEVDASQEKDLNKIAYDEALSSIPLNREDLVFSYKILERFKAVADEVFYDFEENNKNPKNKVEKKVELIEKIRVLVVGVQNEVVEEWKNIFAALELKVEDFSLETFSTFQGLFGNLLDHAILIVDIGASITNVSIISEHGLMYSSAINAAGNYFSKKLQDGIGKKADGTESGYDHKEVGQLKREIGILPSEKFVNVPIILKSAMLQIVEEVKTALKYYNMKTGKVINEVILVGGSSKLKGSVEYLSSNLSGLKYELIVKNAEGEEDKTANKDIKVSNGQILAEGLSIEFTEALGLALRRYNTAWNKISPVFPLNFNANEYGLAPLDDEMEEMQEESEGSDKLAWVKEHKQLVQLLVLLVVGTALLGWAFWYRGQSAKKVQLAIEQQKTYEKAINVKVLVATGKTGYGASSIKARIYKDVYKENLAIDKLVVKSKEFALKQTKPGEKLWEHYINVLEVKKIIFPVTMEWLIYNEKDVTAKFIAEAKKQHNNDKDFGFKNVEVLNLEKDGEEYYLTGRVNIATKTKPVNVMATTTAVIVKDSEIINKEVAVRQKVDLSVEQGAAEASSSQQGIGEASSIKDLSALFANSKKKFVSLDDSGLTWLNVRVASSTKAAILTKIYPKNVYELIDNQGEWYKIKVDETQEGWVSATYVKILE
ncbi:pilus assembly protein PilM [Candidatus Parcubacteria bacterium]|nr:pilus assembly protein PilM [Patescibacteria group bacterium]MBU4309369.1 pilus assembly protein PilM [Patescibacteria group bacterium]MBU4432102.1 pilus assembly protein PilM [Patescibacteria group bacterium]MBU4577730.1 pilus assembly protein PilM [Patescibacteria group bacterium]MCG2697415.1 pilus assembly protein PilM [Candidatus Parcubacteria bacterium]